MNDARHFGFRSDRHEALSHEFPRCHSACAADCNECVRARAETEEDMQTIHAVITQPGDGRHPGRTYSTEAEAFRTAYYAAAIEKPAPSKVRDRVFGVLIAIVVVVTLIVLAFAPVAPR